MTYEKLLERLERLIAKEYSDTLTDIRAGIDIQRLIQALERNDLNGVIAAMNVDEAVYGSFNDAIRAAYLEGGMLGLQEFPRPPSAPQLIIRFNVRNIRAESWLATKSSSLVKQIQDEQREAIKVLLEIGMEKGNNPRAVALDLVGRINKATGIREGGVVGLTKQQAKWLVNAREELEAGNYSAYLERKLRDKRFDALIKRALKGEATLTKDQINNAIKKYQTKIERFRGEMIARSEGIEALNAGQYEGLKQGLEKVGKSESDVSRKWDATGDARTRQDHYSMDGQEIFGTHSAFTAPDGSRLRFPGDKQLGASAAQTIMCRCTVRTEIDYGSDL